MNRLAQEAVLIGLARRLEEQGSWSGETHVQKAAYLVSELLAIPFDFNFILYKHGPFSFELREELGSLRADRLLDRVPQGPKYGPRMLVTDRGRELEQRFDRSPHRYAQGLDWIAEHIDSRRLATAMWVTRQLGEHASVDARARELVKLKSHVPLDIAVEAVEEIDELQREARELT